LYGERQSMNYPCGLSMLDTLRVVHEKFLNGE
jgi:hypothetical protein